MIAGYKSLLQQKMHIGLLFSANTWTRKPPHMEKEYQATTSQRGKKIILNKKN